MKFFKQLKSLDSQIASLPKLYYNHIWITKPYPDGSSFFGISQFSKQYFTRLNKIVFIGIKPQFGISNRFYLSNFINQTKQRKQKGQLCLSQKMQWERFYIKKNQPFAILQTVQFDIELSAPVDMRVTAVPIEVRDSNFLLTPPCLLEINVFDESQINELLTEQQYLKSKKMFML